MRKVVQSFLFALGLIIALIGIGADYILPDASPGLNLPQLLLIVAGFMLAWVSSRLAKGLRGNGGKAIVVSLLTLLALEIMLTAVGTATYYPTEVSDEPLKRVDWWICDEDCRFVQAGVAARCAAEERADRFCIVNKQGYGDRKDFTLDNLADRPRILFLGDSFTQGYTADLGRSFVETVERGLPSAVIWNGGMPGTGTNQAVATFARLGPLMQPHLTILGFYVNDFRDNLYPVDSRFPVIREDGAVERVRNHYLDETGNAHKLPETQALLVFARAGHLPIPPVPLRLFGNTRLGSLMLEFGERVSQLILERNGDPRLPLERERTTEYLQALQQMVSLLGSELLVFIIGARPDSPSDLENRHEVAISLMQELQLAYLDTAPFLQAPADYAAPPDGHWNSAGHEKIGALLRDCAEIFLGGGSLADCEHVVMPGGAS